MPPDAADIEAAAPTTADPPAPTAAAEPRWRRPLQCVAGALDRLLTMTNSPVGRQVYYPPRFRMLLGLVVVCGVMWILNYFINVWPTIEAHNGVPCSSSDGQLTYNAKMLFMYFLWLSLARASLFLPCVAARVALVQSRTHGFCRTYVVHLVIRDGPLYIFVVGSMLFGFQLMQSRTCEGRKPELYNALQLYAIYSCMISILCLMLAYWHNKILMEAARQLLQQTEDRSAPIGTLEGLTTLRYDSEIFGDEEGKRYPAECVICLALWEPDDTIKVTSCHHAFHEECIGSWLQTARTCALCRQDLTKPLQVPSPAAAAGTCPAPTSRPQEPAAQVLGMTEISV